MHFEFEYSEVRNVNPRQRHLSHELSSKDYRTIQGIYKHSSPSWSDWRPHTVRISILSSPSIGRYNFSIHLCLHFLGLKAHKNRTSLNRWKSSEPVNEARRARNRLEAQWPRGDPVVTWTPGLVKVLSPSLSRVQLPNHSVIYLLTLFSFFTHVINVYCRHFYFRFEAVKLCWLRVFFIYTFYGMSRYYCSGCLLFIVQEMFTKTRQHLWFTHTCIQNFAEIMLSSSF